MTFQTLYDMMHALSLSDLCLLFPVLYQKSAVNSPSCSNINDTDATGLRSWISSPRHDLLKALTTSRSLLSPLSVSGPLPACDIVGDCYAKPVPEHKLSSLIIQLLLSLTASCSPSVPTSPSSSSSILMSLSEWITLATNLLREHNTLSVIFNVKTNTKGSRGVKMFHHPKSRRREVLLLQLKCHISNS